MGTDLLSLLLTIIASGFTIFFFIKRKLEDKKELLRKVIEEDEMPNLREQDEVEYHEIK